MGSPLRDLFVFEMANNHNGSVEHGVRIIAAVARIARQAKIKAAVKFQFRDLETFIHPDFKHREDVKHIGRFMSTRLSLEDFRRMADAVTNEGLLTMATPFDETSVHVCQSLGISIIKVASCSSNDWPLLEAVVTARRPVVISTGGLRIDEIDNVVTFMTHRGPDDFALMHCVGTYPTPKAQVQMAFLRKMIQRYPYIPIGYSGHEAPDELDVVKAAIATGARLLERHVGVASDQVPLNKYSMSPEQTATWVAAAQTMREILGDGEKHVPQEELDSLRSLKRGVYAARDIKEGATLHVEDVFYAMPCQGGQTTSGEFGQYRASFTASRAYKAYEPIQESLRPDTMSLIRSIIHEAKGALYEAKIELGKDAMLELSHHRGIEDFRRTGALIVTVVNREYCKKLVIMLPGQSHPTHRHLKKEETFQLLSGDLELVLNGVSRAMAPGDTGLVERGTAHSFSTRTGAIFEEISTTHHPDDSFYEDEAINRLDPIQRKTVVDVW